MKAYVAPASLVGGHADVENIRVAYGYVGEQVRQLYSPWLEYVNSPNFADVLLSVAFLPEREDLEVFIGNPVCSKLRTKEGELLAEKSAFNGDDMVALYPHIRLCYPWDIIDFNTRILKKEISSSIEQGEIHPRANILGQLHLGEGSVILPGVVIEGAVSIGKNCRIGPNCYIRGEVSVGDNCVIGQSVEIKSSVIGNDSFVSHLAYVGDSLIGNDVNIAAGCVCSNFRHDGGEHVMILDGKKILTRRTKWGAWLEDGVRLGTNTVIYPGRHLSRGTWTVPGEIVVRNKARLISS